MKRDMDLVRTLLLKVEELPAQAGETNIIDWWDHEIFDVEGHDRDTCIRHFDLLMQAGYLAAGGKQGLTTFFIAGLTWEGHDFVDVVRDAGVWKQTKEGAKKIGGWTLPIIAEIAKGVLKAEARKLGLPI